MDRLHPSGIDADGYILTLPNVEVQPQFQEQRSILNTISRLRQALESSPTTPAGNLGVRDEVAIALTNLDNSLGKVLEVQTEIGARLNLIDTTEVDNEDGIGGLDSHGRRISMALAAGKGR